VACFGFARLFGCRPQIKDWCGVSGILAAADGPHTQDINL